jgi:hypothetical protein
MTLPNGTVQDTAEFWAAGKAYYDPAMISVPTLIGAEWDADNPATQEVELHLAYRWFCRLDLNDKVPHHSPFLRTGCIGSGKAMSFATYSRGENHPMPAA